MLLVTTSLLISIIGAALADGGGTTDSHVTVGEVADALADTPGVLADSDAVKTTSDGDSAATASVNGTTIDVPKEPTEGVDLSGGGTSVNITPPNAEDSGTGKTIAPGVVAFPSKDGSATAVQATESGAVRMITVIDDADAPTEYTYKVDVPDGAGIQLTDDGSALVVGGNGEPVLIVPPPWAKDANNTAVPTRFAVGADGESLTQVVEHRNGDVIYPVTADPFWNRLGNYLGCIFGVGVPVGLAVAIAMYPPSWAVLIRASASIAVSGRVPGQVVVMWYLNAVRHHCAAYFRG